MERLQDNLQISSVAAEVLLAPLGRGQTGSRTCSRSGLHQGADHGAGVQVAQVVVGLPCAHEHDGLARNVGHGDGGPHLPARQGGNRRTESADRPF